jgi:TetR/AcrR family fatty acid metabolism transcriptional regulator
LPNPESNPNAEVEANLTENSPTHRTQGLADAQPNPIRPSGPAETEATESAPRSGEKYDRILEAAVEVIAEKGMQNARISDIASRAGIADGTVYLYFENKNHILRTALDLVFKEFSQRVSASLEHITDPIEQLRIIARLHLEVLLSHRNLAVILQTEVRQSARFIEEFSHQALVDYINLVREAIRKGQREGSIRAEISDRVAALCLFGAVDELISSWLFTGRPLDPEQASAQVLDIVLNGIRTRRD